MASTAFRFAEWPKPLIGEANLAGSTLNGSNGYMAGGDAKGEAIYNAAQAELNFCSLANNMVIPGLDGATPPSSPPTNANGVALGAAVVCETNALLALRASILNANMGAQTWSGPVLDLGWNLSSDGAPVFGPQSRNFINAMLGEFRDHGGPTFTALPAPGSPAIDAAPLVDATAGDQRGAPRPAGAAADIGATESLHDEFIAIVPDSANIQILFDWQTNRTFTLETSTNLTTWIPAATNVESPRRWQNSGGKSFFRFQFQ